MRRKGIAEGTRNKMMEKTQGRVQQKWHWEALEKGIVNDTFNTFSGTFLKAHFQLP
jgi:hypothetical protein